MEPMDIEPLEDERPQLYLELQWRKVYEVYKLNDTPTGPDAERAAKRTWILLAKGENNNYIIQSQAGTKSSPDKFITWIHYGGGLDAGAQQEHDQPEPPGAGYILIDKAKVGRPRRVLTDAERQEIQARHEAGESINAIARALHMGTRRIMEALK